MKALLVALCSLVSLPLLAGIIGDTDIIMRGDANADGVVNVSDANAISDYLYNGGEEPACANQGDVDDNGALEITDVVYLMNYLYNGGPPPASPGPWNTYCLVDTTHPNLACDAVSCD